jgi:ribosomal protein S18 acetylase RimI-like enzyme
LREAYGPDLSDAIFAGRGGGTAARFHARLFRHPTGLQSYTNATVAEANGRVIALVSHARWSALATSRAAVLYAYVRTYGAVTAIAVYLRARRLMAASPTVPTDHYFVPFIAVAPDWRGRQIGPALMARAHVTAAMAGAGFCSLYVAIENRNARRFFEGLGYVEQARKIGPALARTSAVSGRILMSRHISEREFGSLIHDSGTPIRAR